MHIKLIARAALPGGGMGASGMVLDLPEAEARPLVKARLAEAWPPPPEPPAEPAPGAGAETVAGTNPTAS